MRIFWLLLLFCVVFCIDITSKVLMQFNLGSEHCYSGSPYLTEERISDRPIYNCVMDIRSG